MTSTTENLISIIVPTRNQHALLRVLIDGLNATAAQSNFAIELLIVNNNSDETESIEYLTQLHKTSSSKGLAISVLNYAKPFNYSAINNFAVEQSRGQLLCFMNNDMEIIDTNWLDILRQEVVKAEVGCVGALLLYPDNTVQHAGIILGVESVAGHIYKNTALKDSKHIDYFNQVQTVSANTGACLMVRKNVFEQVNGFDEKLKVAFNDVDFCLKVQSAGFLNRWLPTAVLYHHESKTRGVGRKRPWLQRLKHKLAIRYMQKKWPSVLVEDPHQSINSNTQAHR